jgi:hypothetical protein
MSKLFWTKEAVSTMMPTKKYMVPSIVKGGFAYVRVSEETMKRILEQKSLKKKNWFEKTLTSIRKFFLGK